jgi:Hint domain
MSQDVGDLIDKAQRSRRNVIKMGAILGSVAVATMTRANAKPGKGCKDDSFDLFGLFGFGSSEHGSCNCFLKGTKIRTIEGERNVEDLAVGDILPTMFKGVQPIQWIGRYPLKKSDPAKPWVKDSRPVRIARSALAAGVPQADLYVTSGHAVFVDGVLVPAGCLINGTTITRHEAREYDELEFFHIKLGRHDVIYAEGAPVETLLRVDEGAVNFAEYFRSYGSPNAEEAPCVSRVSFGGGRGEFKSRARSAMAPWLDRREPLDVIRDRLEERGFAVLRE